MPARLSRPLSSNSYTRRRKNSFCAFKFSAQLDWVTVRHDKSEIYDLLGCVDYGERHTLHQSSLCASGDIEKAELARISTRRHLSLMARPISAVTIMRREQTIAFHVEHSDLMVGWASSIGVRLVQNCGTAGCDANRESDRNVHDRALPRTRHRLHLVEHLLCV